MADWGPEKNSIRSGSVKRQIDFLDLRDLKARLANDNELLQSTIADGPAFADQDTGDDMYPVFKKEYTPSYIYSLPSREVSPVPHVIPQRGLTRTAMLNPQGEVNAARPDTAHAAWWDSGREQLKRAPFSGRYGPGRSGHRKEAASDASNAATATFDETKCGQAETSVGESKRCTSEPDRSSNAIHCKGLTVHKCGISHVAR